MLKRYIYYCFTPYHLMNSIYYANKVKCENGCEKVLIWHEYADYCIDIDFAKEYFDEIIVIPTYSLYRGIKKQFAKALYSGRLHCFSKVGKMYAKQKMNNVLICFSDQHEGTAKLINLLKRKDRHNRVCLVEEGASIYSINAPTVLRMKTKIVSRILGIRTEPYIGNNKKIDGTIVKKVESVPKEKWISNNLIKQNNIFNDKMWGSVLQKMLGESGSMLNISKSDKAILWLGDPLGDVGGNEQEEVDNIKEAAKSLEDRYTIYLKPHPRDKKDKYDELKDISNIHIMEFESGIIIPIEVIANSLSPEIIITAISAAAGNLFDVGVGNKLIYIFKMHNNLRFDENIYKKYIEENDNIFSANSMEELVDIINRKVDMRCGQIEVNTNEDIKYIEEL